MRMALLTAQKMSDDLVNEAKTKSANILAAAEKQAKSQKEEINRGVADEGARLQAAKEATAAFVSQSKEMIKKHLEFLASLKEIQAPEIPAAEPQPAADAEEEKEDKIMDAAMAIDSAVSKMYEDDDTPASPNSASAEDADASAPTRTFRTKKKGEIDWEDEGEPTSPRPKFNFDDLKFGSNYDED
jgi:cell division initiation protein